MAKNSTSDPLFLLALPRRWAVAIVASKSGLSLFRLWRRLRYRAVHPNMKDPGKPYALWLKALPLVLIAIVVLAAAVLARQLSLGAIVFVVIGVMMALIVYGIAAAWLWSAAESRRRAKRYVICEDDYADAPRQVKLTMRRIYKSARSMRCGDAYKQDMFGNLELGELVYSAAERAVLSAELSATTRDLQPDAGSADRPLLDDADTQTRAISDELAAVESALARSANAASGLSKAITAPQRLRAAEQAKQQATAEKMERRDQARERLEVATTRAASRPDLDPNSVEDKITAVSAGYSEAKRVSREILSPTTVSLNDDSRAADDSDEPSGANSVSFNDGSRDEAVDDAAHRTRNAIFNAAKSTASRAAKLSAAAARVGVEKMRDSGHNPSTKTEDS